MADATDQHAVWESIAASFDRSRDRTWTHVADYLARLPADARVLDLMCGNGRHTRLARDAGHDAVCFDWARPLVATAHDRYGGGVVGDATRLPFRDASFDACTYVAGWHGIPSAEGRAASLQELHRVLRPGGTTQITSWSRNAPRFRDQGPRDAPFDTIIPWRSDGHDASRTYHLTTLPRLQKACEAAGFTVEEAYEVAIVSKEPDNLVVELRR